jgi:3-oxoadipate enol-lactonase
VPRIGALEIAVTDAGAGPAFFWGHGFTSSSEQESTGLLDWKRLARDHRIVRWDAPGHGRSDGNRDPGTYRWDAMGASLPVLADQLGIDRFVAGGVSMGAASALWSAVSAPDRVSALVLVLAPTAYETRAAQAAKYEAGADLVEQDGFDAYVEVAKTEPVPEILRDLAGAWDMTPQIAPADLPFALRGAAASNLPDLDEVRTVDMPVLLLAWVGDPGHPVSTSELLADALPRADVHVAQDLGDVLGWTDRVAAFLDQVPG